MNGPLECCGIGLIEFDCYCLLQVGDIYFHFVFHLVLQARKMQLMSAYRCYKHCHPCKKETNQGEDLVVVVVGSQGAEVAGAGDFLVEGMVNSLMALAVGKNGEGPKSVGTNGKQPRPLILFP